MAAGVTYEPIATTTLSSASSTVTFTSISNSYTDLVLVAQLTTAAATNMRIRFNGNSTSNYGSTHMGGNGGAPTTGVETTNTAGLLEYNGGYPNGGSSSVSTYVIHLNNYSNTTTWKTYLSRASNTGTGTEITAGVWRQTSAINEVQIRTSSGGNISVGSVFTLYGIAAA
jgi:hypothetical protein